MVKTLDLQELFGQSRDIVVKGPQGVEYALRRPDEMGPKEMVRFERLQRTYASVVAGLEGGMEEYRQQWEQASEEEREKLPSPEEHEDEWADRIESLVSQIMAMLNADLNEVLDEHYGNPFQARVRILDFYRESLEEEGKNATTESPPPSQ